MNKVMVVDDEKKIRRVFCEILDSNGFSPISASNGEEAIDLFQKDKPDAVLLDLKMPGKDGIEILGEMKLIEPKTPVIVMTAYGDVPTAVEAIKIGAYDFLLKPVNYDSLIVVLKMAIEKFGPDKELQSLNFGIDASLERLMGKSDAIKKVIEQIYQVAWSDLSVIIQGETGTGKSFFARVIHDLSERGQGPFVKMDMGTIPETLVESELFGYEKGAFTGADKKKKGYFELAHGGAILIDEVQNASPHVQSRLLMIAEEKRVYPVGSTGPVDIDVRIMAATNTDIRQAVREKKFREDLYFRLGEFMIVVPPLRDRLEDIPFLAAKFCVEAASEMKKEKVELSMDCIKRLKGYSWPGNVRELKNVIKRAVLVTEDDIIQPESLVFLTDDNDEAGPQEFSPGLNSNLNLSDMEKMTIKQALEVTNGNKTKAAAMLKISYATLFRKIKQHGF